MEQYWTENIAGESFEDAALKNKCIEKTEEPILIFANRNVTSGEELVQMLEEYPYMEQTDVLVLCKNAPAQSRLYDILMDLELEVYAIIVKRNVFNRVGPFNDQLNQDTNREFLCRVVQECDLLFLECEEVAWKKRYEESALLTNAYILVRYLELLQMEGKLEEALTAYMIFAEERGGRQYFKQELAELMDEKRTRYNHIYLATAPFLILKGDAICYGVLVNFADALAAALLRKGQWVIRLGGGEQGKDVEIALSRRILYRAIIGFQAPILLQSTCPDCFVGQRFEFWFDHPMFFHTILDRTEVPVTFLCQDGDHADYINRMCAPNRGIHFLPAVNLTALEASEKKFDISFMGTYFDDKQMWEIINQKEGIQGKAARELAQYLLTHVDVSFDEAAALFLETYPQLLEEYSYVEVMENFFEACRVVPYTYRKRVIRTILDAGYELHVYGDSWKEYPKEEGDGLVLHDEVAPADMAKAISQSRISLNVMTWHKDGMTERIMEIMAAGAVCLTDESRYLKKHFSHLENVVMYRLDRLDMLPELIGRLLEDEKLRKRIAENAYRKIKEEHTWEVRANQLLTML